MNDHSKRFSVKSRYRICSAAVLASMLILSSGTAWAKACTDTKNNSKVFGSWTPSAKTTVKNQTKSTTILVEIYRGESEEKQHKYLNSGEETNFTANLGGQSNKALIRVQFYPEGSSYGSECAYNVKETNNGEFLLWSLPTGANSVCPNPRDIGIDCNLDFHKQKYRWHTVFTVTDP